MTELSQNDLSDHVSIIMRTKDRAILLVRAIASVLAQKHDNWHLYLVNDGGGGDYAEFEQAISSYLDALDKRLTIIHHDTSLGMEAASNAALAQLRKRKGRKDGFIIVHDDDDSWHPDFLLKTTQLLQKEENRRYAGVITNCEVVHEKIINNRVEEIERVSWEYFRNEISYLDILNTNCAPPISFLIREDVVGKIGSFNAELPVLGDWDLILRVMQVGDIASLDEKLAFYHHRIVEGENNPYANTVTAGHKHHIHYNTLYTNALIRDHMQSDPHLLGLYRLLSLMRHDLQAMNPFDRLHETIKYAGLYGHLRLIVKRTKRKFFKKRFT